jgi:hypothetical protein
VGAAGGDGAGAPRVEGDGDASSDVGGRECGRARRVRRRRRATRLDPGFLLWLRLIVVTFHTRWAGKWLAQRARGLGLRLMAGAMVETRVGLLAMAHVVAALGGVDWVDLDTAFLLADDPFQGGWMFDGPRIRLIGDPGLGVSMRGSG